MPKRTSVRGLGLLMLSWLLTGCNQGIRADDGAPMAGEPLAAFSVEAARTYVYECDGLDAVVHTAPGELSLFLPGSETVLRQVPSASGVRYEGEGRVFWSRDETVSLEVDGKQYGNCRSNAARAPWADAARRGIDFRAQGNEPAWFLEVDERQHIRLVTDYGERSILTPAPEPGFSGGVVHYDVQTDAHRLRLEIEPRACEDSMSAEAFDTRVQVRLDNEEFRGCGRYLPTTR